MSNTEWNLDPDRKSSLRKLSINRRLGEEWKVSGVLELNDLYVLSSSTYVILRVLKECVNLFLKVALLKYNVHDHKTHPL